MGRRAGIARDAASDARERFLRFFGGRSPVRLEVLPVTDESQALKEVDAARAAGVDGVFLVNDAIGHQKLLKAATMVATFHRDFFVGVNCLDLRPQDVLCRLTEGIRGVWALNAGIWPSDPDALTAVRRARCETGWQGLFFGGIRIPLQFDPREQAPSDAAADRAAPCEIELALSPPIRQVDVVTIGELTGGKPVSPGTLQRIRRIADRHPLAVVGSRAAEPAAAILAHVDCILAVVRPVRSDASISEDFTKKSERGFVSTPRESSQIVDITLREATIRAPPTRRGT